MDAAIAAWTRTLPAKDAEAILEEAEVPCSRLFDIADCASDPHFRARQAVQELDDPLIGRTLHPGPAIRLDGERPEDVVRWTGPAVGAHTDHVLHTLLGLPRTPRLIAPILAVLPPPRVRLLSGAQDSRSFDRPRNPVATT